jgi:hypothetical protein
VSLPDRSNGVAAAWVKPVVVADDDFDDFDDVSDVRASIAADAALKAGNMTELRQRRITRLSFWGVAQQGPCHREKPNETGLFLVSKGSPARQLMPAGGRFFRPQDRFAAALP